MRKFLAPCNKDKAHAPTSGHRPTRTDPSISGKHSYESDPFIDRAIAYLLKPPWWVARLIFHLERTNMDKSGGPP